MNRLNFASLTTLVATGALALASLSLATACGDGNRPQVTTASGGAGGQGGASGTGGHGGAGGMLPVDCETDPTGLECLDGDQAVFVDGSATAAGDGTQAKPYATITEALADSKRDIYICNGTYGENVVITSGKRLIGGFACDWTESAARPSIRQPDDAQPAAIVVTGGEPVELWQLTIEGTTPSSPGGSSIGIMTIETPLRVASSEVLAEPGAGGEAGVDAPQTSASSGVNGGNGQNGGCTNLVPQGGTTAANIACADSTGGRGGNGVTSQFGQPGLDGNVGPSNFGFGANMGGSGCTAGGVGASGMDGMTGLRGRVATWRLGPAGFALSTAGSGAAGSAAQGGGGGGSVAGGNTCGGNARFGGGGGAGATGGCGGTGGSGGSSGGASIGIAALKATVTLLGTTVIRTSNGGAGGAGGLGQSGGVGGQGGVGGHNGITPPTTVGHIKSCNGGNGGLGGRGGRGGGGVGGPSIGVAYTQGSAPVPTGATYELGSAGIGGDSDLSGIGDPGVAEETLVLTLQNP